MCYTESQKKEKEPTLNSGDSSSGEYSSFEPWTIMVPSSKYLSLVIMCYAHYFNILKLLNQQN